MKRLYRSAPTCRSSKRAQVPSALGLRLFTVVWIWPPVASATRCRSSSATWGARVGGLREMCRVRWAHALRRSRTPVVRAARKMSTGLGKTFPNQAPSAACTLSSTREPERLKPDKGLALNPPSKQGKEQQSWHGPCSTQVHACWAPRPHCSRRIYKRPSQQARTQKVAEQRRASPAPRRRCLGPQSTGWPGRRWRTATARSWRRSRRTWPACRR